MSCDPTVTFDLPETNSECGPVALVQNDDTRLSSGSIFPTGTTILAFRAANAAGSATCSIEVEILPELEIQHISGVQNGDTLHIADCLPPDISKDDLGLGPHQDGSSLKSTIFSQDLPSKPGFGLWRTLLYTYEVEYQCGNTDYFENYVALYDLDPPVFRSFPNDITIDTPAELPPVPNDVRILDICRYVVWDTVTTTPVTDPETSDTLAFLRRWMAEDAVGNKSFRDQMIYIRSTPAPDLNGLTAHIAKESDLIGERFPNTAGTDSIPVTLYRIDSGSTSTAVDSLLSGNWQGSKGNVFFTPLLQGTYKLQIHLPRGYKTVHPDSLIHENGWSGNLDLEGDSTLNLGTILLVPEIVKDTFPAAPGIEGHIPEVATSDIEFTIYPNPSSGRLKIGLPKQPYDFIIYNHLGKTIQKGTARNGSVINLSEQANGMYFIRVGNGKHFLGTKRILLFAR